MAHRIAGILVDNEKASPREILSTIRRSSVFRTLTAKEFRSVTEFMEKRGLLGRRNGPLTQTARTKQYYYQNLSMIPDERRYSILDVTTQRRIGILGEEFVLLHARKGVHFICSGRVWEGGREVLEEVLGPRNFLRG